MSSQLKEIDYQSKMSRGHKPDWYQLMTPDFKPFDEKEDDMEEQTIYRNNALKIEIVEHSTPIVFQEAEYQGRKVKLNKPIRTGSDEPKKFKVYVKDGDKVKMVRFGHQGGGKNPDSKTMRIKKSNPERRKSFRARHNCDTPGPKTKARYWSCKAW